VYANYFRVEAPKLALTRYNVEVSPEAKGRKLERVFELFLAESQFSQCVSDHRSMIISLQDLGIQDGHTINIVYLAEGQDTPLANAVTYRIRFVSPTTLDVGGFVDYLRSSNPTPVFPQQLETIQALNVLFGHHPRADTSAVSIGQNRHFSIDRSQQNLRNIKVLGGGLESLRGYFQSLRPATGGLLLNVNVTHGVFLQPERLVDLMPSLGTGNLNTLQKKLKLVRVKVTHLPGKVSKATNTVTPRVKTIFGLAHTMDGRGDAHPPQIQSFGAGPKGVKFWLAAAPGETKGADDKSNKKSPKKPTGASGPALPANTYITVFDYFRKSRFCTL
jgi:eukaryotic translation initiation factor 2C